MRSCWLLLLFLAAFLAEPASGRDSKRVRQVCVPDATGTRWICAPEHEAPTPPPAPTPMRPRPAPPPPPFLQDPRLRYEALAPIRPNEKSTAASEAIPRAESRMASPAPESEPKETRTEPQIAETPPSGSPIATASAPAPTTEKSAPPPRSGERPQGRDFLALPPESWAIQLAAGEKEALRLPEGIAAERGYLLPLSGSGHLLLLAPYPSLEEARAEAAELSARLGRPVWPRRIGPLQNELRRVANLRAAP